MDKKSIITIKDISKALKLIEKEPLKRKYYGEYWVETNISGIPIKIGLTKIGQKQIKKWFSNRQTKKLKGYFEKYLGVPIVVTRKMK